MYIAAVRLPTSSAAPPSASNTSKGSKISRPPAIWSKACSTTSTARRSAARMASACSSRAKPLPHFNEVDECAGLDGSSPIGCGANSAFAPENTLHDLRWGAEFGGRIRLGVPHQRRGAAGAFHRRLERREQRAAAADVFPPRRRHAQRHAAGHIVWSGCASVSYEPTPKSEASSRPTSRVAGAEQSPMDLRHVGWKVVKLPDQETERRWRETTPQWPIMHAVFKGVTRDQMMARHKSNHIQVVYAPQRKAGPPRRAHQGRRPGRARAGSPSAAAMSDGSRRSAEPRQLLRRSRHGNPLQPLAPRLGCASHDRSRHAPRPTRPLWAVRRHVCAGDADDRAERADGGICQGAAGCGFSAGARRGCSRNTPAGRRRSISPNA